MSLDIKLIKSTGELGFTHLDKYLNDITVDESTILTFSNNRKEPLIALNEDLQIVKTNFKPQLDKEKVPMSVYIAGNDLYIGYHGRGYSSQGEGHMIGSHPSKWDIIPGFIEVYNIEKGISKVLDESIDIRALRMEKAHNGIYVVHCSKNPNKLYYIQEGKHHHEIISSGIFDIALYGDTLYALYVRNKIIKIKKITHDQIEDISLEEYPGNNSPSKFAVDNRGNFFIPTKADTPDGIRMEITAYYPDGKFFDTTRLEFMAVHCFRFHPKHGLLVAGPTKLGYELHCYKINYT